MRGIQYKRFFLIVILTTVVLLGIGCSRNNYSLGDIIIEFFSGRDFRNDDEVVVFNDNVEAKENVNSGYLNSGEEEYLPLLNVSFSNAETGSESSSKDASTNTNASQPSAAQENGKKNTESEEFYWMKESNLKIDTPGGQLTWELFIVQGKNPGTNEDPAPPATSAVVLVELQGGLNQTLGGTVDEDGWVRWTTPEPDADVKMYLRGISGELTWAEEEKAFWTAEPVLAYTEETTVTR